MSSLQPAKRAKRKVNSLHLGVEELKCKNGCGYYGNPEWQGYCSKCHRDLHQKMKHDSKHLAKKSSKSGAESQDSSLSLTFSKFEEKKKQQTEKRTKTIKSIIKRGNTLKESPSQLSLKECHQRSENVLVCKEFADFVKNFPEIGTDLRKELQIQCEKMRKHSDKSIDDRSELMQDFYHIISNKFETSPLYHSVTPEQADSLMDLVEKTLMTSCLYRSVFQQIASEYEEKDLTLQNRIRNLNWITPLHLDTEINENHPEVRDLIDKAITDIIEVDSKRAPQEKLSCIVNCSKNIFNILHICRGTPASADEFLPAMVYIVLKANPPLLQSNIKFITSYSIPTRLMSGEGGYYFTNLCCAVSFIENLSDESLNLTREEYERYLSGEVAPSGVSDQTSTISEDLRLIYQNLSRITDLQNKQTKLIADAISLQKEINKSQENMRQEGSQTEENTFHVVPYTISADFDISFIPYFLRSSVIRELPPDEILVEIDSGSGNVSGSMLQKSVCELNSTHSKKELHSEQTGANILDKIPLDVSSHCAENSLVLPTSKLVIPEDEASSNELISQLQLCPVSSEPSKTLSSDVASSHSVVSLASLSTEVCHSDRCKGPQSKLQNIELVLNVGTHSTPSHLVDPLSPGTDNLEESLNLPPPLQPVVLPSSSGMDIRHKSCRKLNCKTNSD